MCNAIVSLGWRDPVRSGFYPADIDSKELFLKTEGPPTGMISFVMLYFYTPQNKFFLSLHLGDNMAALYKCYEGFSEPLRNVPDTLHRVWSIRRTEKYLQVTCDQTTVLEVDYTLTEKCKKKVNLSEIGIFKVSRNDNATTQFFNDPVKGLYLKFYSDRIII